jgi:hypothetical protein
MKGGQCSGAKDGVCTVDVLAELLMPWTLPHTTARQLVFSSSVHFLDRVSHVLGTYVGGPVRRLGDEG